MRATRDFDVSLQDCIVGTAVQVLQGEIGWTYSTVRKGVIVDKMIQHGLWVVKVQHGKTTKKYLGRTPCYI